MKSKLYLKDFLKDSMLIQHAVSYSRFLFPSTKEEQHD
jgi:hypothetical protein